MANCDFYAALNSKSVEEALTHIELEDMTIEELEDLAWCFAFNNGNSKVAPSDMESALASVCLDQIDKLEAKDADD